MDHDSTRRPQGTGIRSALELVAVRGIHFALLLTFVRLWINLIYRTFLPVFLVDNRIAPGLVGAVMAVSGLVAAFVAPSAGYWTRVLSQPTVAVLGLGCGAVSLLLSPYLAHVPVVFVLPALLGIGVGLSLPLLMSIVTAAVPPEVRDVALGLRSLANQTASTSAPILVGPMITAFGMTLGFIGGGVVALTILVVARLLVTNRGAATPGALTT